MPIVRDRCFRAKPRLRRGFVYKNPDQLKYQQAPKNELSRYSCIGKKFALKGGVLHPRFPIKVCMENN
jgi:hypothetical protein